MEHKFNMDNFYLPLDSLQRVLIGLIILDSDIDTEYLQKLGEDIARAIHGSGYHQDTVKFGFYLAPETLLIYKEIPIFDIEKHLEGN